MDDTPPSGAPAEPFFDEFRRLQPDVDVVLLPPEQPVDAPITPTAEADRLAAVAMQVADDVVAACGLPVDFRFDRWEQVREEVYEHLTRIRVDRASGDAALDDLIRVRDFLVAAGWRAKAMDTPVPWFVAETGEGLWRADVSLDGESLFVEVATVGLRLEADPT